MLRRLLPHHLPLHISTCSRPAMLPQNHLRCPRLPPGSYPLRSAAAGCAALEKDLLLKNNIYGPYDARFPVDLTLRTGYGIGAGCPSQKSCRERDPRAATCIQSTISLLTRDQCMRCRDQRGPLPRPADIEGGRWYGKEASRNPHNMSLEGAFCDLDNTGNFQRGSIFSLQENSPYASSFTIRIKEQS